MNNITFTQNGNTKEGKTGLRHLRCHELERQRYLVKDDRRQRNHQKEKCERECQHPERLPAVKEQNATGERANERNLGCEYLRPQNSTDQQCDASENHDEAEDVRFPVGIQKYRPSLPSKIESQRYDEKTVRVVLVDAPIAD